MKGRDGERMWIECGEVSAEGMVRSGRGRGRWGGEEEGEGREG